MMTLVARFSGELSTASRPSRRLCSPALARVALILVCLGLAGCGSSRRQEPTLAARFYVEAAANEASVPVVLPRSGVRIRVSPKPVLSEYDVTNVAVAEVELGRCLAIGFTAAAGDALLRLSQAHDGRRLVLLIDGEPVGARVLDSSIEPGRLLIFVERTDAELTRLAARLQRSARGVALAGSR
jgi:hypothetical protein